MRVFVLSCLLQLLNFFSIATTLNIPFHIVPKHIKYKSGENLKIDFSFKHFPELPPGRRWQCAVYLVRRGTPVKIVGPVGQDALNEILNVDYHLKVDDDGATIYVVVRNDETKYFFKEDIVTVTLQQNRSEYEKDECLDKCDIVFDKWIPLSLEMDLITIPPLNSTTHYQIGDKFSYTCTGTTRVVLTTFKWILQNGTESRSYTAQSSSSRIDLVLDESYHNVYIRCEADYQESDVFKNISIATKLILRTNETAVPWYRNTLIVALAAAAAVSLLALGGLLCCCRRRGTKNDAHDSAVDVQNDLYGPQYAQLYEQRACRGPPPPPPAARAPYANVVGYLQ